MNIKFAAYEDISNLDKGVEVGFYIGDRRFLIRALDRKPEEAILNLRLLADKLEQELKGGNHEH